LRPRDENGTYLPVYDKDVGRMTVTAQVKSVTMKQEAFDQAFHVTVEIQNEEQGGIPGLKLMVPVPALSVGEAPEMARKEIVTLAKAIVEALQEPGSLT
jgi:hypothetical protein